MAIGDDNVIWGPPTATTEQLASAMLRPGEVVCETGVWRLRLGDGITLGGIVIGSDGSGGAGGSSLAFKTIAVTGADPVNYLNADKADDTLTLTGARGIQITPNPSSDTITLSLPHGGAIGNLLGWTGETYVPVEPPTADYVPQEGFANNNLLLETEERKFWDGRIPLLTYMAPTNTPSTVTINDQEYPSLSATVANYMRNYNGRIPAVTFNRVYVGMRLKTTATSGNIFASAKIDKITNVSDAFTFSTAVTGTFAVPDDGDEFDIELDLGASPDGVVAGDYFVCEFGRVGSDAADTADATCVLTDSWVRLA